MRITHDEMLIMVRAMKAYGGSFVVALAECFLLADSENTEILLRSFPEYVSQYMDMAGKMPEETDGI